MMSQLDMTARYRVSADAMESRLGDETVILHLGSGTYFGLDFVGTLVWEALQSGATPEDVCAQVRASFKDAPPTVDKDISEFLSQLIEHGLIGRD